MISYKILKELEACEKGLKLFEEHFGIEKEYTIEEFLKVIKVNKIEVDYKDVKWLIRVCGYCQTEEMIKYFKSLNPTHDNVKWLIIDCPYCQTKKMLEYYKSLNPGYRNVIWLIVQCKYCQTKEMIEYYKSLDPYPDNVRWLIYYCEYCQSKEIKELLLKGIKK